MGTPVYSPYPHDYLPEIRANPYDGDPYRLKPMQSVSKWRASAPALPWRAEDLIGTTWRGTVTGTVDRVVAWEPDAHGDYQLVTQTEFGISPWHLGVWEDDRYVVDNAVRVDHLAPDRLVQWLGVELAFFRYQLARAEEMLDRTRRAKPHSSERLGLPQRKREVERGQAEVERVLAELAAFGAAHQIAIPLPVVNAGAQSGQQLALFWGGS
ncbi:MAG TPA: hypothetical protein PKA36_11930 [Pseudoxanthomonas mexicana]|nr:hypothetical protein [Pseudoxanthomonas mexicana]